MVMSTKVDTITKTKISPAVWRDYLFNHPNSG